MPMPRRMPVAITAALLSTAIAVVAPARASVRAVRASARATLRATPSSAPSIRAVDFRNFNYEQGEDPSITVVNGVFDRTSADNPVHFRVLDVAYGDFSGDGRDDAIVTTVWNGGGTGQFTEPRLFVLANGSIDEVGTLGVGDRADGGVHDAFVRNGKIVVDNYGQNGTGACCPTFIERTTFAFRGKGPVAIGRPSRRAYLRLDSSAPSKLRFLPGTAVATVEGDARTGDSAYFDANEGQRVTLAVAKHRVGSGSLDAVITLRQSGGGTIAAVRTGATWSGVLPASSRYTLSWAKATPGTDPKHDAFASVNVTIN